MSTRPTTSWGQVANWYDELLAGKDAYQATVILPNLLRLLEPLKKKRVLDLGCGQGFFARELVRHGAGITGVDISPELIALARARVPRGEFIVGSAEKIPLIADNSYDAAISILSLQNIKNVPAVFKECARLLQPAGRLHIVLNHPAFRIPRLSSWGWDEKNKQQYRRLDGYLSESAATIDMHPGQAKNKKTTLSFHRPLQYYFKLLANSGFAVSRLEEWTSPKTTPHGPRAAAENIARKEFPLFLFLEAVKSQK